MKKYLIISAGLLILAIGFYLYCNYNYSKVNSALTAYIDQQDSLKLLTYDKAKVKQIIYNAGWREMIETKEAYTKEAYTVTIYVKILTKPELTSDTWVKAFDDSVIKQEKNPRIIGIYSKYVIFDFNTGIYTVKERTNFEDNPVGTIRKLQKLDNDLEF